ncbi:unnamed protein product, partial [Effrenium voratum]
RPDGLMITGPNMAARRKLALLADELVPAGGSDGWPPPHPADDTVELLTELVSCLEWTLAAAQR